MKKRWLLPVFTAFMLFAGTYTNDAEAATYNDLTTTAYKYIGVPYSYGGTTTSGFDCSGFTQKVFKDLGINLSRTTSSQYAQGTTVAKSNLAVGDLVFFNTSGKGVSHVGIYVGSGKFVHTSSSKGVMVSGLSDSYWSPRYYGAKRITTFTAKQAQTITKKVEEVKSSSVDLSVYASRAAVAKQLAAALKLNTSNTASVFPDVKSTESYAGAVNALHRLGIFIGDEKGKFNPNSPITRAEMSKVLVVAYNLKLENKKLSFSDVKQNHWAYKYVNILASTGITIGVGNGEYGAKDNVKLVDLATFINRAAKK